MYPRYSDIFHESCDLYVDLRPSDFGVCVAFGAEDLESGKFLHKPHTDRTLINQFPGVQ